jgi:hypothetical protein
MTNAAQKDRHPVARRISREQAEALRVLLGRAVDLDRLKLNELVTFAGHLRDGRQRGAETARAPRPFRFVTQRPPGSELRFAAWRGIGTAVALLAAVLGVAAVLGHSERLARACRRWVQRGLMLGDLGGATAGLNGERRRSVERTSE